MSKGDSISAREARKLVELSRSISRDSDLGIHIEHDLAPIINNTIREWSSDGRERLSILIKYYTRKGENGIDIGELSFYLLGNFKHDEEISDKDITYAQALHPFYVTMADERELDRLSSLAIGNISTFYAHKGYTASSFLRVNGEGGRVVTIKW